MSKMIAYPVGKDGRLVHVRANRREPMRSALVAGYLQELGNRKATIGMRRLGRSMGRAIAEHQERIILQCLTRK